MIEADFAVVGIGELATPFGPAPKTGQALSQLRVEQDAAVAARAGAIVYVGRRTDFERQVRLRPHATVLDAQGGTVLPGFVDAHTHLVFAGWREAEFDARLGGATYREIAARGGGILSTVRATREASREALAALVRERLDAILALGTTTVEIKSGYGLSTAEEIKLLEAVREAARGHPVQVVPTCLAAHTIPPEYRERRTRYLDRIVEEILPQVAQTGLARYADAFVDDQALGLQEARRVLEAARDLGLGVRLHADQFADEGAAALAAELGAASADHLEFASPEGLERMARAGTCGVLLPAASFFLMMERRPPGRELVRAGVPVVLATDFNPGSCPCEAMPAALWFGCLWGGLRVDEAITAATLNAAYALGLAETTGSLEVGKRADLVVHAVPNRYHLVYRFGVPRVRAVVAGGRLVVPAGDPPQLR